MKSNINLNILDSLKPEVYKCFYKVVYDYYNAMRIMYTQAIVDQENEDYDKLDFTVTIPQAKFYFLKVPANKLSECFQIIGSYERIIRESISE